MKGMVKKSRVGMVGTVVSWCIWKARNGIIFNGGIGDTDDIVFKIKYFFWWWLDIGSKCRVSYTFYE